MNLDQEENSSPTPEKTPVKKKLSRKEKKTLKKAKKASSKKEKSPAASPAPAPEPKPAIRQERLSERKSRDPETVEVEAKLDPAPVEEIPPPTYTAWEKISPPARRKKQIATMESGFREVLGLVHSMRHNQEVLLESFQKLPEAVESVKKLADHSAQQSDLLKAMNDSLSTGSAGEFNKTLSSMDQTTQLLLERAQRSEERLYSMLRRAQRRIAFMTLMVLLLFLGAVAAGMFIFFPEKTQALLDKIKREDAPVEAVEVNSESADSAALPLGPPQTDRSPIDQPMDSELPEATGTEPTLEPIELPDPEDIQEISPDADPGETLLESGPENVIGGTGEPTAVLLRPASGETTASPNENPEPETLPEPAPADPSAGPDETEDQEL